MSDSFEVEHGTFSLSIDVDDTEFSAAVDAVTNYANSLHEALTACGDDIDKYMRKYEKFKDTLNSLNISTVQSMRDSYDQKPVWDSYDQKPVWDNNATQPVEDNYDQEPTWDINFDLPAVQGSREVSEQKPVWDIDIDDDNLFQQALLTSILVNEEWKQIEGRINRLQAEQLKIGYDGGSTGGDEDDGSGGGGFNDSKLGTALATIKKFIDWAIQTGERSNAFMQDANAFAGITPEQATTNAIVGKIYGADINAGIADISILRGNLAQGKVSEDSLLQLGLGGDIGSVLLDTSTTNTDKYLYLIAQYEQRIRDSIDDPEKLNALGAQSKRLGIGGVYEIAKQSVARGESFSSVYADATERDLGAGIADNAAAYKDFQLAIEELNSIFRPISTGILDTLAVTLSALVGSIKEFQLWWESVFGKRETREEKQSKWDEVASQSQAVPGNTEAAVKTGRNFLTEFKKRPDRLTDETAERGDLDQSQATRTISALFTSIEDEVNAVRDGKYTTVAKAATAAYLEAHGYNRQNATTTAMFPGMFELYKNLMASGEILQYLPAAIIQRSSEVKKELGREDYQDAVKNAGQYNNMIKLNVEVKVNNDRAEVEVRDESGNIIDSFLANGGRAS